MDDEETIPPSQVRDEAGPGFFARNRLWIILSIVAIMVLACSACGLGMFGSFAKLMKGNGAYVEALSKASNHPQVIAELGEPIEDGLFIQGNIQLNNNDGTADYSAVPLAGPKGKAVLSFKAEKTDGVWKFEKMNVHLSGSGQDIDLLK